MRVGAGTALSCACALVVLVACGGDDSAPGGSTTTTTGAAGGGPTGCAAGTVEQPDGSCRPAGVRACAEGFVADGPGCNAILPAAACPPGQIAVPGDASCRAIMDCGADPFGTIPDEPTTQYVDGSYAGTDSDGSKAKPWTSIQAGVDAAESGALVAVAAGTYAEDIGITKVVRVWGRCPDMVEVVATGAQVGGVLVTKLASGSEIGGLAIRGSSYGVVTSGSQDVVFDRLWIHDTTKKGVSIETTLGDTSATLRDSLVEHVGDIGVGVLGATATLERTVIRDTKVVIATGGRGLELNPGPDSGEPATVTMKGSVIELSHADGAFVRGCHLVVEGSVIRDTAFEKASQKFGAGITAQPDETTGARAQVEVRGSVLERNHESGILAAISDVVLEDSVIRDQKGSPGSPGSGTGLVAQNAEGSATVRATAKILASVIERSEGAGVVCIGSDVTLEESVVRDTVARASDLRWGKGVHFQGELGFLDTFSTGTVRACVIENNRDAGIAVVDSKVSVDATLVRGTQPETDGRYGDGVVGLRAFSDTDVVITGSRIEANARAGIVAFGAHVSVGGTQLECNTIQLDKEVGTAEPNLEDAGGNHCGCDAAEEVCKVLSTNLEAPTVE